MKRRILSALCCIVMIFGLFASFSIVTNAAPAGTSMSTAVNITFGKTYSKIWHSDNDHLNHFVKFTLSEQGIVTIKTSKPYDDEGEPCSFDVFIYDSNGDVVCFGSGQDTEDDIKDYHSFKTGLAAGTYYANIDPNFYMKTGSVTVNYVFSFDANNYCEIESNDSGTKATAMVYSKKYTGYFGRGGYTSDGYEEADYWKFNIKNGVAYRLYIYGYDYLADSTTTIADVIFPDGTDFGIGHYPFLAKFDSKGNAYIDFKVEQTGTVFIQIYNYHSKQYEYGFKIENKTCLTNGHSYSSWSTTKKATCTTAGSKTRSCSVCGNKETETIKATGHKWGNYIYNDDATETKDGTKTRTCSTCSKKETVVATGTKPDPITGLQNTSSMFVDIPANAWFKNSIDYAVSHKLMSGVGNGLMQPNGSITRAQFVQILANISGVDTSNKNVKTSFKDVPKGKWYTPAVKWAFENEIVSGTSATTFSPDTPITREQMCVMLVNYSKFREITLKKVEDKAKFKDDKQISSWAKTAVYACQRADLVNGKGDNKFDPKATATRAEAATIFKGFHSSYLVG